MACDARGMVTLSPALTDLRMERRDEAPPAEPPRDFARSTLKPRHRPLVRALAEAMFAHTFGPSRERLDRFVDEFDAFVSFASRTLRFGLLMMLGVVRFAPLFLLPRFATFETLGLDDRVRVVARMATSRFIGLALVLTAYKAIFSLIFFEHDDELAALGYRSERYRHRRSLRLAVTKPDDVGDADEVEG